MSHCSKSSGTHWHAPPVARSKHLLFLGRASTISDMPELPEVETMVRRLRKLLVGRTIVDFVSYWPRQVSPDVQTLRAALTASTIAGVTRRGKHVVLGLGAGKQLLIHPKMTGRFEFDAGGPAAEWKHTRAVWRFGDGACLAFCDARKFGRIRLVDAVRPEPALGIEPLSRSFTAERLKRLLASRRGRIKPLLLNQALIAGLGNIYTDEALFRAGIHPLTPAADISPARVTRLHRAIRQVLQEAVRKRGTSFDWAYAGGGMQGRLRVYGRARQACYRCAEPVQAIRVGQRGTHFCPRCQKAPSHLRGSRAVADRPPSRRL